MMNLLEKFELVEIKNEHRLSTKDNEYIENLNKNFEILKTQFLKYKTFTEENELVGFREIGKNQKSYYGNYNSNKINKDLCENYMRQVLSFIYDIYEYFTKTYNVKLIDNFENKDTEYCLEFRFQKAMDNLSYFLNFDYNLVLDDIYNQLGGFTFEDKADKELKVKFKKHCVINYGNGEVNIRSKVKSKKISIDRFIYIDSFDAKWGYDRLSYSCRENITELFNVLTYFDCGLIENNHTEVSEQIKYKEGYEVFTIHELNYDKIESIKIYKNGKLDINFKNGQLALEFAREYCGLDV